MKKPNLMADIACIIITFLTAIGYLWITFYGYTVPLFLRVLCFFIGLFMFFMTYVSWDVYKEHKEFLKFMNLPEK